jgi:hypothetical protein
MKKNNASKVVLSLSALFAAIAVFCMFAGAFNEDIISVRGNVFTAMFGTISENGNGYKVVWPLVGGFVLLLLSFLVSVIGLFLGDEAGKVTAATEALCATASGVLFLFTTQFYVAANADKVTDLNLTGTTSLGPGPICVAVFAFLAALCGVIGFLTLKKKD